MSSPRTLPINEDDVLIAFALRFDGYKYQQESGFEFRVPSPSESLAALDGLSPIERMTMLFLMQRYLYKWGGEYLPKNGRAWQVFRQLFLMTCRDEVPEAYRPRGTPGYDDWAETWGGAIVKAEAAVRRVHESTKYDPFAQSVI
jgi:hypothetical protein